MSSLFIAIVVIMAVLAILGIVVGVTNDAINFLDLWVTDGGNNDSFWSNEEYDNLIAQATAEADEEVRQQYLFDAEEILAAEMPVIPLYWQCQNYSYNKDKIVDGAIITANQTTFYYATLAE